jgi:hypothetical protein
VDSANEAMGQEILRAFEAGSSLRAIASAAEMSHEKVRAIVASERKRRPVHQETCAGRRLQGFGPAPPGGSARPDAKPRRVIR